MFKKHLATIIYILLLFTIYLLLDTFVTSSVYQVVEKSNEEINYSTDNVVNITDNSYEDENIKIELSQYNVFNTNVYVADIVLSSPEYLKTAFAKGIYGKNITDKTSNIAESVNAILAINGDYYGVQEKGYVLKDSVIYRDISAGNKEDLLIYSDGRFEIINEADADLETLVLSGASNILSFGPALIKDGNINVSESFEVARAMSSNPRTAIGIIDELHYVFVVSDGRTNESEGMSLYELAEFLKALNVEIGYNLDGGGSSTMYFNGKIINNPTTSGKRISERSVSDIVYIGY